MTTPSRSPLPRAGASRAETRATALAEHRRRDELARRLAADHGGVVTLQLLLAAGLTRGQIRTEVDRGAWHRAGWRTLCVEGREPAGDGRLWRALWESGSRAVLDGATSLLAAGLTGWREDVVHVSLPHNARARPIPGVAHHFVRELGPTTGGGLVRTRPEVAAIRAAQWAVSDRQAATVLAMTIQQRLTTPVTLLAQWATVRTSPRRRFLTAVLGDVCDGAHSLNELDFARLCRARRLPEPTRQAVRTGERGRVYLDAYWEHLGVHVEIQGVHHVHGLATIEDALRGNDLAISEANLVSLQIPVLGLRLSPDRFLEQVERALARAAARASRHD